MPGGKILLSQPIMWVGVGGVKSHLPSSDWVKRGHVISFWLAKSQGLPGQDVLASEEGSGRGSLLYLWTSGLDRIPGSPSHTYKSRVHC